MVDIIPAANISPRRLVYMGTPQMAVPPLLALHAAGFDIPLVVSRADKRRGRGSTLQPSPVKAAALELGIPVTTDVEDALGVDAELGVVVAFGEWLKPHVLQQLPMINLHFSLLPRWRGAAPVERAILEGDAETGVCIIALAEEFDTGHIYAEQATPITSETTADDLRHHLVDIGTTLLVDTLEQGLGEPWPQVGEATYAHKIKADDYRLDMSRPAVALLRQIRLGRAWAEFRGSRFRIWDAVVIDGPDGAALARGQFDVIEGNTVVGTGDGVLQLIEVQPEGKARMAADAWRNGAQPTADDRLT